MLLQLVRGVGVRGQLLLTLFALASLVTTCVCHNQVGHSAAPVPVVIECWGQWEGVWSAPAAATQGNPFTDVELFVDLALRPRSNLGCILQLTAAASYCLQRNQLRSVSYNVV